MDVLYLAPRLRESDVREVRASHGQDPLTALTEAYEVSDQCYVFLGASGRPCAMFGTAPHPSGESASVWLLGTPEIAKPGNARTFLRLTRQELDRLHGDYPILFNFVDERNTDSIRWLKWAGCRFIRRYPQFGVEQVPFLEFIHIETKQPCVPPQ
jgi:hypothetical protein